MESKEDIYLQRALLAIRNADWAESSGIAEMATLYRKVALLWEELALLEQRWPPNPA